MINVWNYSFKGFIEKVSTIGRILEINETTFYVLFQPENHYGAQITLGDNTIDLSIMKIDSYDPLVMWTHPNKSYWNLTEEEAIKILVHQFQED